MNPWPNGLVRLRVTTLIRTMMVVLGGHSLYHIKSLSSKAPFVFLSVLLKASELNNLSLATIVSIIVITSGNKADI